MNYRELQKQFHYQVYPSKPNEWDIEEALHPLEKLEEEQQRLLLQAIPTIWPISHSLSFCFLREGARNADGLDSLIVAEWIRRILRNYEEGGLKKARKYMAESELDQLDDEDSHEYVKLSSNLSRLIHFARGISGLDLNIHSSENIFTDTETIYLPEEVSFFKQSEENLLCYKLFIGIQAAFIQLGSLSPHRLMERTHFSETEGMHLSAVAEGYFNSYEKSNCAKVIYQLMETYRAFQFLQKEYPGLVRETKSLREELLGIRVSSGYGQNNALEDLFVAIFLPEQERKRKASHFLSLLSAWQPPYRITGILSAMYAALNHYDDKLDNFSFFPFMDSYDFKEAARAINKRILENKKKFATSLADVLVQKEILPQEETEGNSGEHKADSVRILISNGDDGDRKKVSKTSISINNKNIELPEDLLDLMRHIHSDIGQLPESYVTAAFGIAARGRTVGEGTVDTAPAVGDNFISYDEWDYRRYGYRKNWCSLRQRNLEGVKTDFVDRTLRKHHGILLKIRRQFEMMRTQERFARRRRNGDDLDLDAVIDSLGDRAAGLPPSEKLFIRLIRDERSIVTYFLVDMSNSTEGWVGIAIKEALVLLCEAMEAVGDRYGIYGFSGMRRMRSEVYRIKTKDEQYSEQVKGRIGAIAPKEYTRMGPPIRHMVKLFADMACKTKLLLILSDGKPEDYDDYKGQYAIEDTRKALAEARGQGIHPYCITIDQESHDYLEYLFGKGNYTYVKDIALLPTRLTEIYRLLTR